MALMIQTFVGILSVDPFADSDERLFFPRIIPVEVEMNNTTRRCDAITIK